jgi:hypothetical protein
MNLASAFPLLFKTGLLPPFRSSIRPSCAHLSPQITHTPSPLHARGQLDSASSPLKSNFLAVITVGWSWYEVL